MCEALQHMARGYVMVKTDGYVSSGVLVRNTKNHSYVLTCAHNVDEGDTSYKLARRIGGRFVHDLAHVTVTDKEHDLAILVGPRLVGAVPVPLADSEPDLYTHALTLGSNATLYGIASDALITAAHGSHGDKGEDHLYLYTGVAHQGMSGGMLCNLEGELVGILSHVLTEYERPAHTLGYAVDLPTIKHFLKGALS